MITIKGRYDGRALYVAKNASDVRAALQEAVKTRANLSGADLSGAYLSGAYLSGAILSRANLSGADLSGADLSGAYLSGAYLSRADLSGADLSGADLSGAILSGADLSGADLSGAILSGARGFPAERHNDLLILLDQPGKIRAYKLVTAEGDGIYAKANGHRPIRYKAGETVEVKNANTDPLVACGAGINVATLPWCLKEWKPGYRVLLVEFVAKDIAAIPAGDGKFRLHRCKVLREKQIDPVALGLVKDEASAEA